MMLIRNQTEIAMESLVKNNISWSKFEYAHNLNLPIINIILLFLLLFTSPRKNFDANISYFGIDRVGDDSIAIIMLILLSVYTVFKRDSNETFFNQLSIMVFTASITVVYFFDDVSQLNPAYMYGLFIVYILFIVNIYLQGFNFTNLKRFNDNTTQISGVIGLFLSLLLLAFWALPFQKTTYEMFGGGTWEDSDKSILVKQCCGLADFGTYNLISESVVYSLLIAFFVLQISGFSIPVFAVVASLFSAFLSIIRMFLAVGSSPFKPHDGSTWTQDLLDKYRPTETVGPTFAFYMFSLITTLIVVNSSILYILNSAKSKTT